MPSPPGTESDPFFDSEFIAPDPSRSEPDLSRLDIPGLELRRFIRDELRALTPQLWDSRPPRPPRPAVRVRARGQAIRGER